MTQNEIVDAAIAFYCRHPVFHEEIQPLSSFARLTRGDLRQVLINDPSGNPVEVFEPIIGEARLSSSS
jgi:hypothetical protein